LKVPFIGHNFLSFPKITRLILQYYTQKFVNA